MIFIKFANIFKRVRINIVGKGELDIKLSDITKENKKQRVKTTLSQI